MAWLYAQIEFSNIVDDLDRMFLWLSDDTHCYFAVKEFDYSEWTYFGGNVGHALETGNLLTEYTEEADAQTNYFLTVKDTNGFVYGMLPQYYKAKYVRIYIDDEEPTQLYEFNPENFWYVSNEVADGYDTIPISANWAYDHENNADSHIGHYILETGDDITVGTGEQKLLSDYFYINGTGSVTIDSTGELVILGGG